MSKMKQLTISIYTLILLCLCLCITSFALGYAWYKVEDNRFKTGIIDINLNDGQPIIRADEFLFEPGMTVEKDFFIENKGTWGVWYKLYFSQVSGLLGDILEVTILDDAGNVLVPAGKLSRMTADNVPAIENELGVGQKQEMTVLFHYPKEEGNRGQGSSLTFELSAVAVQTKNNPDKEFE